MEGNSSDQEDNQLYNQNFEIDNKEENDEMDNKEDEEEDEEEDDNFNTIKELHVVAKESINLIRSNSKNRLSGLEIAAFIIPIIAFYFLYSKINQSPQF